jgi:RNA-directed DNA polymerase
MNPPRTKKVSSTGRKIERYAITSSPLYGLRSHGKLAQLLRWAGTPGQLRRFSLRADNYSRYVDKSKPSKPRLIEAPASRVKEFQARLLDLLRRIELPDYLHSARPGRSYLTNSASHCGAQGCTITMDIDSFFQSVTLQRVARFFEKELMCVSDVAETLARLLCCDAHLATGSPASPLVSYWAYRELFDAIDRRARLGGGVFTLYVDDMGITGNGIGHTDIRWIDRLLRGAGLTLKKSKTRLFHADAAKLITGRAFRNGISRAPNKQHQKTREAQEQLRSNPSDKYLKAKVAGLKRHLALLDEERRDQHRAEAAEIVASK